MTTPFSSSLSARLPHSRAAQRPGITPPCIPGRNFFNGIPEWEERACDGGRRKGYSVGAKARNDARRSHSSKASQRSKALMCGHPCARHIRIASAVERISGHYFTSADGRMRGRTRLGDPKRVACTLFQPRPSRPFYPSLAQYRHGGVVGANHHGFPEKENPDCNRGSRGFFEACNLRGFFHTKGLSKCANTISATDKRSSA